MTPISMMTSDSLPGQATVSIWTGWRFMSSDTAWDWNIPTYGNLSCTLGTRDIKLIFSLLLMILKEYKRSMVS